MTTLAHIKSQKFNFISPRDVSELTNGPTQHQWTKKTGKRNVTINEIVPGPRLRFCGARHGE